MANIIALDVETANEDYSTICQIGLYEEVDSVPNGWASLVNPECSFRATNTRIHGIKPEMVTTQPTFPAVYEEVVQRVGDRVLLCYTTFDRNAIEQACARYNLPVPEFRWLDAAMITRELWSGQTGGKYNLKVMADLVGIQFNHHDACDDARVCYQLTQRALEESNTTIEHWVKKASRRRRRVRRPAEQAAPREIVIDVQDLMEEEEEVKEEEYEEIYRYIPAPTPAPAPRPRLSLPVDLRPRNRSPKNVYITLILWLLLGYVGAHRWYAGRGSWLFTLTFGYVLIGWLFDLVLILAGRFRDGSGRPIWF